MTAALLLNQSNMCAIFFWPQSKCSCAIFWIVYRRLQLIWAKLHSRVKVLFRKGQKSKSKALGYLETILDIFTFHIGYLSVCRLSIDVIGQVYSTIVPIPLCSICVRGTHPYLNEALSVICLCDFVSFSRIGRQT